jgi:phosphotransferase system enzyme I (PtsI)
MSTERFQGDPIAPGFAAGQLHLLEHDVGQEPPPPARVADPAAESDRFRGHVDALARQIEDAAVRLEAQTLGSEAEILRTHVLMLRDPDLHRQVVALIEAECHRAEIAVQRVLDEMSSLLGAAEDPVLAERASDLRDLSKRLAAGLSDQLPIDIATLDDRAGDIVLVLPELLPSVVLEAREQGVVAFVVQYGTAVSHGAILAKSFGMPVVRMTSLDCLRPFAGRAAFVWEGGEVVLEPSAAEIDALRASTEVVASAPLPAALRAGVWTSIVDPEQLSTLDWSFVEGVGLYRSEALFMRHREDFPTEQEQLVAYRRLFELAGARPVVFRTLDLGADKPVAHMRFGPQDNPCLGLRAHRLFRFHPEILITQVRAVLRAATGAHQLQLLFPMLETIEQLHFVRSLVEQAVQALADEGLPYQRDFRQGVLVETPSAAWSFERFLPEIDFASVGTNDLVQYLFAVERNTANVADLYQPEHPVALQVIAQLVRQAADAGKPLHLCGELAADTVMLPVLLGLGIRHFSVAPGRVAAVRTALGQLDEAACLRLGERCLAGETAEEVRALLGRLPAHRDEVRSIGDRQAVDPVCGMVVTIAQTPYVAHLDGVAHYFCSVCCLRQFTKHRPRGAA